MPSARIFQIPFWFHANAVQRKRRNAEKFLLRGSFPFEMPMLSGNEAPMRLRARLRFPGHPSADNDIALRHDGVSYLRAVDEMPREPGAERPPFTEDDFLAMLEWRDTPWPAIYGENDKLKAILTTSTEQLSWWENAVTRVRRRPAELQTVAEASPSIREWEWSNEDKARQEALHEIAGFVFVDGHLHRRVGLPLAYLSSNGYPHIVHADEIDNSSRLASTSKHRVGITDCVMPITCAPVMKELSCQPGAASISCDVDAPLESDPRSALAFSIAFAAPDCAKYLAHALEDMTADGMRAYRTFRDLYPRVLDRDYDSCIDALKAMHEIVDGPSFAEAQCTDAMRARLRPKLYFLDTLARSSGLIMDRADEEALLQIAT